MTSFPKDAFNTLVEAFLGRFQSNFQTKMLDYTCDKIKMAQYALSNLLGGIGYFYGDSYVYKIGSDEVQTMSPQSLLTATPSRSAFPRGFLWDEGFHLLFISQWDLELTLMILESWICLIDNQGWIAREQILGEEARSYVPSEFIVQNRLYANPPTLICILIDSLINRFMDPMNDITTKSQTEINGNDVKCDESAELILSFLTKHYPKMRNIWIWFRCTQHGNMKDWGRDKLNNQEGYCWKG